MNIYLIIILLILIYSNFNEKFGLDLDSEINNCKSNSDCPENYKCINHECINKINI
jgi:hypothetical protein